jgi:hypothetical protein
MKKRTIIAAALACVCATFAWSVQFHYGIGSCGPASDTPFLCLVFGMGPFYLLTAISAFARMIDAVPNLVALGVMFLLPVIIWFAVFLAMLTAGNILWGRLVKPRSD